MMPPVRPLATPASILSPYALPPDGGADPAPLPRDSVTLSAPPPAKHSRRLKLGAAVLAGLSLVGFAAAVLPATPISPPVCASITLVHATTPQVRADATWKALQCDLSYPDLQLRDTQGSWKPATLWPYGQAMAAALDQAKVTGHYGTFNELVEHLEEYHTDRGGYTPDVGGFGNRFYDDNAWIGLDLMQAYGQTHNAQYLQRAQEIFKFIENGLQPQGGVLWQEHDPQPTLNTCVQGPAIELALRLHLATAKNPRDTHDVYFQFAQKLDRFMESQLRMPNGLYRDHITLDGKHPDDTIYSYNQGTPIGANVLFYRITGDSAYLQRAQQTADAALRHFGQDDAFWKQPPAFNAIFLRNLLQLHGVAPDARYPAFMQAYGNRAWSQARDERTGLFIPTAANGFGSYGTHPGRAGMIDQAAMAQIYSLESWSAAALVDVS